MKTIIRLAEYKAMLYRVFLVYVFYFLSRIFFAFFNWDLLEMDSFAELMRLSYHGLAFDTTAILYSNMLFILLSILPFGKNSSAGYQKFLFYFYFVINLFVIAFNYIDFIYYKFTFARSTINILESVENESNKGLLLVNFLQNYWYVFVLYFVMAALWIYLYKLVKVPVVQYASKSKYYITSVIATLVTITLCIGGIRGDFKKSTRPINLVDANKNVSNMNHAAVVLNTPFAIMRTFNKTSFKKENWYTQAEVDALIKPVKHYSNNKPTKPNVVLLIIESFSKEYNGAFNKDTNIEGYQSFTPFVDSLAQHSLIFTNAFTNGYKSIHGMSSIIAGIPSFKDAFTSSPFPNQEIESLVSVFNNLGYDTSFFHGAPNGSMGFLGFANILGYDNYYGKTEYNNDADFDGVWAIWDEPFMQYMGKELSNKKEPFMATLFSASSHEPYNIPQEYQGKFPEGFVPIHKCIGYTDHSLKQFFAYASKQDWYDNTLFIITADHCNQIHYDEYKKTINRRAIPILFFKPGSDLKGVDNSLAQHIDIYPSILDYIGYDKPFRSWGKSLLSDNGEVNFNINYNNSTYQFVKDEYICVFDGKKAIGFYDVNDKGLEHNLIANRNAKMNEVERYCKAFLQDYFNRIIDKNLILRN